MAKEPNLGTKGALFAGHRGEKNVQTCTVQTGSRPGRSTRVTIEKGGKHNTAELYVVSTIDYTYTSV